MKAARQRLPLPPTMATPTPKTTNEGGRRPYCGGVNSGDARMDAARAANANKVELLLQRGAVQRKERSIVRRGRVRTRVPRGFSGGASTNSKPTRAILLRTVKFPGMDPVATASLPLEHGADIESRREDGRTPLIEAANPRRDSCREAILERGAHVDASDNRGNTALIAACGCAIIDMPDTFASMKLLLEKGAKVNAKNGEESTALMVAAGWGRARIVQLLLGKGANIDIKNGDGNTALMVSALGGGYPTADATKVLLAGGAEIEARNNDGATALILAASSGYDDVRSSIRVGQGCANVDAKDRHEHTALALALKNRRTEAVSLLKRRPPGTGRSSPSASG